MDIAEIGFYFLLEIWGSVFRHTDFSRFKISEKKILKNSDFWCYRKMYRLDPCIPILRGGEVFSLKMQKGYVYVNMSFLVLILLKIYVLM